jgi:hypothetical protein
LHSFRRIAVQAECLSDVCGGSCRPVAKREYRIRRRGTQLANHLLGSLLRRFEMERNGAVGPGIFELVTAVRSEDHFDAELIGSLGKAVRLVA